MSPKFSASVAPSDVINSASVGVSLAKGSFLTDRMPRLISRDIGPKLLFTWSFSTPSRQFSSLPRVSHWHWPLVSHVHRLIDDCPSQLPTHRDFSWLPREQFHSSVPCAFILLLIFKVTKLRQCNVINCCHYRHYINAAQWRRLLANKRNHVKIEL